MVSRGQMQEQFRISSHNMSVILTQTDTTVGFLSQEADKLYEIKSRNTLKPFIKVYSSFQSFLACGNRVSISQSNYIRRSKKTTFIIKNRSFRIATPKTTSQIIRNDSWFYSTSANESTKKFLRSFAEDKADIIIENQDGLSEKASSKLIKLNNYKRKKLR